MKPAPQGAPGDCSAQPLTCSRDAWAESSAGDRVAVGEALRATAAGGERRRSEARGRWVAAGGGRGPAGPAGEGGGEAGRARRGEVAVRVLPAERGHADGTQVPVVTVVAP